MASWNGLEGIGADWFRDRYAITPDETWEQASSRVANHVAAAEGDNDKERYYQEFYGELAANRFMPGGRIWYGSGRPKAHLLNCFVIPIRDSREGWGKALYDTVVVSGTGGGVGINFSPVRQRGAEVKGTGGIATGAVSPMKMINAVGGELATGGNRRIALMFDLNISHPDIEEFLSVKLDRNQLNNANVSVVLDFDTQAFVRAVRENETIPLSFGGKHTGRSVRAGDLWNKLVENAWSSGEPGVLNSFEANRTSNIWYHKPLVSTNPCGEIWLEEYGCCDLGALVLPRFVVDGHLDWIGLANSTRLGTRFLDNVLTVNQYPLPEIEQNCKEVRRIGLGVMGLHSMLLELGLRYSSAEGRQFIDKLFNFIKTEAYNASVDLAIEKGAFPAYHQAFMMSQFVQTLDEDTKARISEHGIRNCALLTIAPTGTTAGVVGVSSGIEPLFAPVYYRRYRKGNPDGTTYIQKELVVTPEFKQFGELAEGAYDIDPREHFEMQKIVQKHIDNAVSKTINLPENYPVEMLGDLWLEYLPYLKGTTLYRAGSRGEEPLEAVSVKEAMSIVAANGGGKESLWDELNSLDCPDGVCDISYIHAAQSV